MTTPTLGSLSAAFDKLRRECAMAEVEVQTVDPGDAEYKEARHKANLLSIRLHAARRAMNAGNVLQALSYLEGG